MNTKLNRLVGLCLLWSLALSMTPFLARPVAATSSSDTPDVTKIDAFVRDQVRRHGIPGLALAIVDGDRIIHQAGYGKADQSGRSVTAQTPFVLASVSKPITALAVMQLVEAGKVELDAPVQRYLPDFQLADPDASRQITLRHLLQHTSGIPERGCQNYRFGAETSTQFVAELRMIEPGTPVGTHHFYCSGNYNVLGRIIEVVSGLSFADYVEQHVFVPLQMRHSFTSEQEARQQGLAQGYRWLFGVPVPMDFDYDVPQIPSGFLIASAEDMAHFLIAQINNGRFGTTTILSPKGIAEMHADGVLIGAGPDTYSLGWTTRSLGSVPVVYHDGGHPNMRTFAFILPEKRRGAVILVNSFGLLADLVALSKIRDEVAQMLAGKELVSAPTLSLSRLYLIVDTVLGSLLALALWPLVRLRRWEQRLQQQSEVGRLRRLLLGLQVGWEVGAPLALLIGARSFLVGIGALSWYDGTLLFPDFILWIWTFSLVMLLTGTLRLMLLLRVLRRVGAEHNPVPHATKALC